MQKPNKPRPTVGLRHVALFVQNFSACQHFYVDIMGMKIVWQPDDDNLYLSSGDDNLALHRAPKDFVPGRFQRLDHLGFFLKTPDEVDEWHAYLLAENVPIKAQPKDHRDGTRSLYCEDPDGNVVQIIYYPNLK
jgi:catechol 2,3-dioxygenase-like lactoylglutathione lyase family enzyme